MERQPEKNKRRCLRRFSFVRRDDGATAIEFGLLAMPFFLMVIGIVELGMFFAAASTLEGASAAAARMIRTGQAQMSGDPETVFRTELCARAAPILRCGHLQYQVIRIDDGTFAGAENRLEPEFDEDGNLIPVEFTTGASNDVVMVRAIYRYDFLTPFLGSLMSAGSDSNAVYHMASVVIKAEPYEFGAR